MRETEANVGGFGKNGKRKKCRREPIFLAANARMSRMRAAALQMIFYYFQNIVFVFLKINLHFIRD
jgi:hypothetical protein